MNIQHNESLCERLASEYVLGTLRGGARRRFESWLKDDAALRKTVSEWQDRIYPLAELTAEVEPSQQLWEKIEKRVDKTMQRPNGELVRWWNRLHFWRGLSIASIVVCFSLVAFMSLRQPDMPVVQNDYVAILMDKDSRTRIVVTGDIVHRQLSVKILMPQSVSSNEDLQLWALPKQGAPHSLGLLASNGEMLVSLPDDLQLETVLMLAVSLEHKGGSANPNGPTGPVMLKGELLKI